MPIAKIPRNNSDCVSQNFKQTNFARQKISAVNFSDCEFTSCDFTETKLIDCQFHNCRFKQCQLAMTQLAAVSLNSTVFTGCKLIGMEFSRDSLGGLLCELKLRDCRVLSCHFVKTQLSDGSEFCDCHIEGSNFNNCRMINADFSGSELRDCNFAQCNLTRSDFRYVRGLQMDPRANQLENAKFSMDSALGLLTDLGIQIF